MQFVYLLLGFAILFLFNGDTVLKEMILISGWVFVWIMLEVEIFADKEGRRKRKILKKY